jgi:succinate-semialdehyde dehydrogenase/glutarate-semialdehyde dehydrogenase
MVLQEWARLVQGHGEDLAVILSTEQGKPLHEARAEINQTARYLEWFSAETQRICGENVVGARRHQRIQVLRQPLGVCGAITAWTFPSSMVARRVGAALAAGCTVVHHPDPQTPFSALALCMLAECAGLPRGVFSVLTGHANPLRRILASNPAIRKLSFTGSTEEGKALMATSASTVKKVSLELGANCPFIVFSDANLKLAVDGAISARFRHSGQAAMCASRFYVHDDVYEQFISMLSPRVESLRVGDGFSEGSQVGPLINDSVVANLEDLVDEAVAHGAKVTAGGSRVMPGSRFFRPTVLSDVQSHMRICGDEVLGPVASVLRFRSEEDVVEQANSTQTGLAGYFYTADIGRTFRVMEALECGVVGVNDSLVFNEAAPFGGVKQSGFGREGASSGIDEYLETKYVCFGNL